MTKPVKKTPVIDCPSCQNDFQIEYDISWVVDGCAGRWVRCPVCSNSFAIQYEWKMVNLSVFVNSVLTSHDL